MFLQEILNHKRFEVEARKEQRPLAALTKMGNHASPVRSFKSSLTGDSIRLIAEVKKASPSKGLLCPNFNPVELAKNYEAAGAAGISVLTDQRFFLGSLDDLAKVKQQTIQTPILRKDFMIDPYQLMEARVYGADAVLLIVAALNKTAFQFLLKEALNLELAVLVEVHDKPELDYALEAGAAMIGINNRDLKTFKVDLETTYQLVQFVPKGVTVVSESGIKDHQDIKKLISAGVNAVLVGESIVTSIDPKKQIQELLGMVS